MLQANEALLVYVHVVGGLDALCDVTTYVVYTRY